MLFALLAAGFAWLAFAHDPLAGNEAPQRR
jgi:hypothetical protein